MDLKLGIAAKENSKSSMDYNTGNSGLHWGENGATKYHMLSSCNPSNSKEMKISNERCLMRINQKIKISQQWKPWLEWTDSVTSAMYSEWMTLDSPRLWSILKLWSIQGKEHKGARRRIIEHVSRKTWNCLGCGNIILSSSSQLPKDLFGEGKCTEGPLLFR